MLFTFLLQHKQTTCIRQVEADDLPQAIMVWIPVLEGVTFGKDEAKATLDLAEVEQELKESRLVALRNMQNVWTSFIRFNGVDALLNVVKMDSNNENAFALI